MSPRVHRVPLAVLAGLALASCRSDKPPAAEAGASATATPAAPSTVTVTPTDFSFDAPEDGKGHYHHGMAKKVTVS